LTLWDEPARTAASVAEVAPADVDGYLAYEALFGRLRRALRGAYTEATDTWLGPSPTRAELEDRLGHEHELVEILFHTPVAAVLPGGAPAVVLEGGEIIRTGAVVSNADPKRTLALCQTAGGDLPEGFSAFADKVAGWRSESPVVKLNCALSRLPTFTATTRPGYDGPPPYRAMVTI